MMYSINCWATYCFLKFQQLTSYLQKDIFNLPGLHKPKYWNLRKFATYLEIQAVLLGHKKSTKSENEIIRLSRDFHVLANQLFTRVYHKANPKSVCANTMLLLIYI